MWNEKNKQRYCPERLFNFAVRHSGIVKDSHTHFADTNTIQYRSHRRRHVMSVVFVFLGKSINSIMFLRACERCVRIERIIKKKQTTNERERTKFSCLWHLKSESQCFSRRSSYWSFCVTTKIWMCASDFRLCVNRCAHTRTDAYFFYCAFASLTGLE